MNENMQNLENLKLIFPPLLTMNLTKELSGFHFYWSEFNVTTIVLGFNSTLRGLECFMIMLYFLNLQHELLSCD
jgi:hypothetical protein